MPSNKPQTATVERPSPRARADSLRAEAARVMPSEARAPIVEAVPAGAQPDPVFAFIAASRAAESAMAEFGRRHGGNRLTAADFAEEQRLNVIQSATRTAALAAVPTTRAGQLAMLDYVRFQIDLFGFADGSPPDVDSPIWADTHKALQAALGADIEAAEPSQANLSGLTLPQLRTLFETVRALWLHAGAELQAPWCWDEHRRNYNAAGKALDCECDRLAGLQDAIVTEAKRRPADEGGFHDDRLALLVRYGMAIEGRLIDRTLIAEIVEAWGEAPRG